MPLTIKRSSSVINIEVDKGSTFRHTFTWKTGVKGGETPVDLTGCQGRLLVKNLLDDRTVGDTELLDLTTQNGGMILGDEEGTVEIIISDEDSTLFDWEEAVYGCEIYFPNSDVRRLFRGSMFAFDEIVR